MLPQGTPNQRPMMSRSGAAAHAAPASQKRAGGPGRRKRAPSAAPTKACEKPDGILRANDEIEIEQVRVRGARHDVIPGGGEKAVGVVVGQGPPGVAAAAAASRERA